MEIAVDNISENSVRLIEINDVVDCEKIDLSNNFENLQFWKENVEIFEEGEIVNSGDFSFNRTIVKEFNEMFEKEGKGITTECI